MSEVGQFCMLNKMPVMEYRVFPLVTSGMYLISSKKDSKLNGHLLTSLMQVSPNPPRIAVSICKENLTHEFIQASRVFGISILAEEASKKFLAEFGFKSGRLFEKFKGIQHKVGTSGAPIILDNSLAYMDCKVIDSLDSLTHTIFTADVIDTELLRTGRPLTYAYYQEVIRGKTPATSPAYVCVC